MGVYVIGEYTSVGHGAHGEAMTMSFLTLCAIQLFHSYNMRSDHFSLFSKNPFSNKYLNASFILGFVLIVLSIAVPGVGAFLFGSVMLNAAQWGICLALAFAIIPMVEIHKLIIRSRMKKETNKEN